jgi:hypothetical protein
LQGHEKCCPSSLQQHQNPHDARLQAEHHCWPCGRRHSSRQWAYSLQAWALVVTHPGSCSRNHRQRRSTSW